LGLGCVLAFSSFVGLHQLQQREERELRGLRSAGDVKMSMLLGSVASAGFHGTSGNESSTDSDSEGEVSRSSVPSLSSWSKIALKFPYPSSPQLPRAGP
jgi:hypothetical protein